MRRVSKRDIQKAKNAIDNFLRTNDNIRYFMLFTLSNVADNAVNKELFSSLYDYIQLVPGGAHNVTWLEAEKLDEPTLAKGLGGDFLVAENPYYRLTIERRDKHDLS